MMAIENETDIRWGICSRVFTLIRKAPKKCSIAMTDNWEEFSSLLNRAYDYEEALRRQNLSQSDVIRFRERIQNSKFVPKFIADKQLLLFLNAGNSDLEKAATKIEIYYELKQTVPEFFSNRDLESEAIQSSLDHQDFVDLPITPDNSMLFFHQLSSHEPKHYVFDEAVKTFAVSVGEQRF
jgi:hypothetical protein